MRRAPRKPLAHHVERDDETELENANKVTSIADGQSEQARSPGRTRAGNGGRLDPEPGTYGEDRRGIIAGLKLRRRPAVGDIDRVGGPHGEKRDGLRRGRVRDRAGAGVARLLALGAVLEAERASLWRRFRRHRRAMARRRGKVRGVRMIRREDRHRAGVRGQCPLQPENSEQGKGRNPTAQRTTHAEIRPYSGAGLRDAVSRKPPCRPCIEPDQAFSGAPVWCEGPLDNAS